MPAWAQKSYTAPEVDTTLVLSPLYYIPNMGRKPQAIFLKGLWLKEYCRCAGYCLNVRHLHSLMGNSRAICRKSLRKRPVVKLMIMMRLHPRACRTLSLRHPLLRPPKFHSSWQQPFPTWPLLPPATIPIHGPRFYEVTSSPRYSGLHAKSLSASVIVYTWFVLIRAYSIAYVLY